MSLTVFSRIFRVLVLGVLVGCGSAQELGSPPDGGPAEDRPGARLDSARADADASAPRSEGARPADSTQISAPDARPGSTGPAQCQRDEDCQLVNDCCTCQAIPGHENPPYCDPKTSCVMPACSQYGGLDKAHCVAGRCILAFDCDTSMIACKRSPPVCPPGQTPRVIGQGVARCYGECVDARQCQAVPSCAVCGLKDLCVRYAPSPQPYHCVPVPAACTASPSCACVQPAVCVGAYQTCVEGGSVAPAISCGCPSCMAF
jgi:hypothetical protein